MYEGVILESSMKTIDKLNNSVWCTLRPSSVHGVGVFAIRDIPKGTLLTDYTFTKANLPQFPKRYKCTWEEFSKLLPEIQAMILDRVLFSERHNTTYLSFISPNRHAVLQLFMNHSNTPNSDGIYALRDIQKDEEVTEDFAHVTNDMISLTRNHLQFL